MSGSAREYGRGEERREEMPMMDDAGSGEERGNKREACSVRRQGYECKRQKRTTYHDGRLCLGEGQSRMMDDNG